MGASGSKGKFREVVEVLKQRDIDEDSHFWNDLWKAQVTAQVRVTGWLMMRWMV